jgi:hypothetical protein
MLGPLPSVSKTRTLFSFIIQPQSQRISTTFLPRSCSRTRLLSLEIVGSILLALFLYLIALISVPVIVFFPAHSISFFAARYPALSAVPYPPVPAPATPQPLPLPTPRKPSAKPETVPWNSAYAPGV